MQLITESHIYLDLYRPGGTLDKATQRVSAAVGNDGQPHSPGIASILPLVLRSARFPVADFDSSGDQRFVMDTTAFDACPTTDPRLINLDVPFRTTADPVPIWSDHASAQLVQDAVSGFVSR